MIRVWTQAAQNDPEHIFAQTGSMPVLACGNADVDIEMLTAGSFALLVNHDDGDREGGWPPGLRAADRLA